MAVKSLLLGAALALSATPATAHAEDTTFTWKNPLDVELRDPQVLRVGGVYYVTGTCPPFFEHLGQSPGVKLWSSPDLLHWKEEGLLVTPGQDHWYKERFWAPEIFHDAASGKYYCTFNCPNGPTPKGTQSVGLAAADDIRGPYTVLTVDKPLCEGNDADLFRDDDGKVYLFTSGINAVEVDLAHAATSGKRFQVLPRGKVGEWDGAGRGSPAVGLEGPSVYKIKGTYYCFYSSWGRGYEVGYATASDVHGPWTRYAGNPIYGAQGKDWAARYKHSYTQAEGIPYSQVGHNSIFTGPDGRFWIAAHAYRTGVDTVLHPHLVIDPLNFEDGVFKATPVSYTEQQVHVKDAGH